MNEVSTGRRFAALVVLLVAAVASAETPAEGPALLDEYNQRDIGEPGLRRIRLELHNDGALVRRFDIAHAWQRAATGADGGEVRSLVLLEQPVNLRGTDYLLVEGSEGGTGIEVYLHLPTSGDQVLEIRPGGFDEGLLGSDFGYTDLLWRIPLRGREVHPLGRREIDGVETRGVEVVPAAAEARAGTTWDRTRYFFRSDPALLVAAEYYRDGDDGPVEDPDKRLRVFGWHHRDQVWSPRRMVMETSSGRTSTLTLRSSRFDVEPLPAELFAPATLPSLTATLRRGETPGFLSPLDSSP